MRIQNAGYLGDFGVGAQVRFKVTSYDGTGAPAAIAGGLTLSVYKDASLIQSSAGVSIIGDFDTLVGLQHVAIDTDATPSFYTAGSDFYVVVFGGSVGGVSLSPLVVASFSIKNRSTPTIPALAGDGNIPVDHNTGGIDALRYTIAAAPADDVTIKAYLKSEYDAGTRTVRGTAHTGVDGRWLNPLMLNAGTYTLVAWIPGVSDPVKTDVVVS